MRNYTYLEAGRFWIINIFRTKRFDIDRLDLNWSTTTEKTDFVRGFRMVDHDDNSNTVLLHGADADNLIFSLAHIHGLDNSTEKDFEEYIQKAMTTKEYRVTEQKKSEIELREDVLH